MGTWSAHHLFEKAKEQLGDKVALDMLRYTQQLRNRGLPVIFTLNHLSKIINIDYKFLHETVNRKREYSNYRMFSIHKRSGGKRFIHATSKKLYIVQTFINREIISKIDPHPTSYAYHKNGGIRACAERHCGARWLFHFDLKDFFFTIHEARIYRVFREIGYSKLLSFELARLCTTTRLPKNLQHYLIRPPSWEFTPSNVPYRKNNLIGVLPQGASTSPMLSNLAARKMDENLNQFAMELGLSYTRYADDITFSAYELPKNWSIGKLKIHIEKIIRESGFKVNPSKFSVSGPGSRRIVLGLLVDGDRPRLSKWTRRRIDNLLYAIDKYGWENVAKYYKFESTYGFFNHVHGLVSYALDVDLILGGKYKTLFDKIKNDYLYN